MISSAAWSISPWIRAVSASPHACSARCPPSRRGTGATAPDSVRRRWGRLPAPGRSAPTRQESPQLLGQRDPRRPARRGRGRRAARPAPGCRPVAGAGDEAGEEPVRAEVVLALGDAGLHLPARRDVAAAGRQPQRLDVAVDRGRQRAAAGRRSATTPRPCRSASGRRRRAGSARGWRCCSAPTAAGPGSYRSSCTVSRSVIAAIVTLSVSSAGTASRSARSVCRSSSAWACRPAGDRSGIRSSKPGTPMKVAASGSSSSWAARWRSARASTAVGCRSGRSRGRGRVGLGGVRHA